MGHGIIFFYLFEPVSSPAGRVPDPGVVLATLAELAWEAVENTEEVINRFRENSGMKDSASSFLL